MSMSSSNEMLEPTFSQMGRLKRPEWDFVVQVKSLGKGQFTCRCKYCPRQWDGGPLRIRAHLLSLVGYGVGGCTNVPDDVKDICRKLHADIRSSVQGQEARVDALVDDLGDNTEKSASMGTQGSTHVSACGSADVDAGASSMKRKRGKGDLTNAWNMQARKQATIALRRFFYAEDIPHWKVRSPFFLDMVKAIGQAGPSYVPPTYYALRTTELVDEVKCIDHEIMGVREKWKKYGCTIVSYGWSDTRRRPIINFLACSIHGTVFLKSVDTSGEVKSGEFIFHLLKQIIIEVGPANVVQVVMDNASNCVSAGALVTQEWPTIAYTRCACHCLDLLFEDIGKLPWVASVLQQASKVVTFVTKKPTVLALFRKLSKKDLVKPAATRFAYSYIMLSNLLDERCMQGLRKLMIDDNFVKKRVSRSVDAIEVNDIVFSHAFWQEARTIVKICVPLLKILRLADREGATMGLIYELTDRMVERVQNMQGIEENRIQEIKELCIGRWEMLHTPLHAVGYMLHPVWKGRDQDTDSEVHDGWMTFLESYTKGDLVLQGELIDEYDKYKAESGTFGRAIAKDEKRMQEGVKWWETFGACTPKLQALAVRLLSQGSCASPCERNWSTFSLIHTKRRNRLLPSHTEKLVYIHTNLRLISKIKERGYERMEVTLDMLNKEKDEDRLLALQELQESLEEENASDFVPDATPLAVSQATSTHTGTSRMVDDEEEEEEDLPEDDDHTLPTGHDEDEEDEEDEDSFTDL